MVKMLAMNLLPRCTVFLNLISIESVKILNCNRIDLGKSSLPLPLEVKSYKEE